jgi:hypothetical protein
LVIACSQELNVDHVVDAAWSIFASKKQRADH